VSDYTVNYSAQQVTIQRARATPGSVRDAVRRQVAAYDARTARALFPDETFDPKDDPKDVLLTMAKKYLRFIYDSVAQRRRAAIRGVREWATRNRTSDELRTALLDYLRETPFTEAVEHLHRAAALSPDDWDDLLLMPTSSVQWAELDAALARAYAEYPESPPILALRSIVALAIKRPTDHQQFGLAFIRGLHRVAPSAPDVRLRLVAWVLGASVRRGSAVVGELALAAVDQESVEWCLSLRAAAGTAPSVELAITSRLVELLSDDVRSLSTGIAEISR
jgi:hypothetical protein